LLCLKADGVKFKVLVTEWDALTNDDEVDTFVQLLQLTPAINVYVANSTNITMRGMRQKLKTR